MKQQVGIWIDHRKAAVVFIDGDSEKTDHIESGMEKHVRFSGRSASEDGAADDQRDRQYAVHLGRYYDVVITHLRDAGSILIFGPGEAKAEPVAAPDRSATPKRAIAAPAKAPAKARSPPCSRRKVMASATTVLTSLVRRARSSSRS